MLLVAAAAIGTGFAGCGTSEPLTSFNPPPPPGPPPPPPPAPVVRLAPDAIADTALVGNANPTPDTVGISNAGTGSLSGLAVGAIAYGPGARGWLGTPTLTATTEPDARLVLRPDIGGLAAGSYRAEVPVTGTGATPDTVVVTLVLLGPAPQVEITPNAVSDTAKAGGTNPAPDTLKVVNAGGGTLAGVIVDSVIYGAGASGWLGAPEIKNVSGYGLALVLRPAVGTLGVGKYSAKVAVQSSNAGTDTAQVTLVVTPSLPRMVLVPASITDSVQEGGTDPAPDTVQVTNAGGGKLTNLAVEGVRYGAGGFGWLDTPELIDAAGSAPRLVIQAILGSLGAGTYAARIPVKADGVADTLDVTLVVEPTATGTALVATPSQVVDSAVEDGTDPRPDTVHVSGANGATVNGLDVGTVSYGPGAVGWLDAPVLTSTTSPAKLVIQARVGSLSQGTYLARIPITGTNAKPDTVTVKLAIEPPGSPAGAAMRLAFATYVPGSVRDVAVDRSGNTIVVGGTNRGMLRRTAGVFARNPTQPVADPTDPSDALVMKLSPTGRVLWAGALGGPGHDRAYGVDVDARGDIYVAGRAGVGFPVTRGAFQTNFSGGAHNLYGDQDGFVCKVRADGTAVIFCSYFGASDARIIRDLAVDPNANIYLASAYEGGTWPTNIAQAFTNRPRGSQDGVIAKISSDGSRVFWARYVGGSGRESAENSVQLDATGNPYFLVTTQSTDAPTPGGADPSFNGGYDLYLSRISPSDGSTVWATYVGGSGDEATETHELAVSAGGDAVVAVVTSSTNIPTTANAVQRQPAGGGKDAMIVRYGANGQLLAATYLGGNDLDRPEGVAIDGSGNVRITGTTTSSNFPVSSGAPQMKLRGGHDAFAVVLRANLDEILSSTLFGGSQDDFGRTAAAGSSGVMVIGGETSSSSLLNALFSGLGWPGFVARFEP